MWIKLKESTVGQSSVGKRLREKENARRREYRSVQSIQQRIVTAQRPLADPTDDLYDPLCRARVSLFLLPCSTDFPNCLSHSVSSYSAERQWHTSACDQCAFQRLFRGDVNVDHLTRELRLQRLAISTMIPCKTLHEPKLTRYTSVWTFETVPRSERTERFGEKSSIERLPVKF